MFFLLFYTGCSPAFFSERLTPTFDATILLIFFYLRLLLSRSSFFRRSSLRPCLHDQVFPLSLILIIFHLQSEVPHLLGFVLAACLSNKIFAFSAAPFPSNVLFSVSINSSSRVSTCGSHWSLSLFVIVLLVIFHYRRHFLPVWTCLPRSFIQRDWLLWLK